MSLRVEARAALLALGVEAFLVACGPSPRPTRPAPTTALEAPSRPANTPDSRADFISISADQASGVFEQPRNEPEFQVLTYPPELATVVVKDVGSDRFKGDLDSSTEIKRGVDFLVSIGCRFPNFSSLRNKIDDSLIRIKRELGFPVSNPEDCNNAIERSLRRVR